MSQGTTYNGLEVLIGATDFLFVECMSQTTKKWRSEQAENGVDYVLWLSLAGLKIISITFSRAMNSCLKAAMSSIHFGTLLLLSRKRAMNKVAWFIFTQLVLGTFSSLKFFWCAPWPWKWVWDYRERNPASGAMWLTTLPQSAHKSATSHWICIV